VISAPVVDTFLQKVLDELGMSDKAELVSFPGQQKCIYKSPSGDYKQMPAMPSDTAMDPNVIFDWLEVREEDREESLKCLMDLSLMPPEEIDKFDDISFAEWLNNYKLPPAVYAFLLGPVADGCFVWYRSMLWRRQRLFGAFRLSSCVMEGSSAKVASAIWQMPMHQQSPRMAVK